jgi:hypothetical protein
MYVTPETYKHEYSLSLTDTEPLEPVDEPDLNISVILGFADMVAIITAIIAIIAIFFFI